MIEAVLLTCLALAFAWWLVGRGGQLKKIFSDAHLIEIAERLGPVKAAAEVAAEEEDGVVQPDDPRVLRTSAQIVIFYTISRDGDVYSHHYSLKDQYGITADAVGATLTLYVGRLLGVAPEALTLQRSDMHVYHAEFALTEEQHRELTRRPVLVPSAVEAKALFQECLAARSRVTFVPFSVPDGTL